MRFHQVFAVCLCVAAVGCAHQNIGAESRASKVTDADAGRLKPTQDRLVDEARSTLGAASDNLARTKLKIQDAKNEEQGAKAEAKAGEAALSAAAAQQQMADQSREPAALANATKQQELAAAKKRAAEAHLTYARNLVAANEARAQVAEQQVEVAQARVDWAKLQALQQAKNPAAGKYDAGRFQTTVNDAQVNLTAMQKRAKGLDEEATLSKQAWELSQRQVATRETRR